jgi:hypothetical protein
LKFQIYSGGTGLGFDLGIPIFAKIQGFLKTTNPDISLLTKGEFVSIKNRRKGGLFNSHNPILMFDFDRAACQSKEGRSYAHPIKKPLQSGSRRDEKSVQ